MSVPLLFYTVSYIIISYINNMNHCKEKQLCTEIKYGIYQTFLCYNASISYLYMVTAGRITNTPCLNPSCTFWAPWIGRFTRRECMVYNTEYRKCIGSGSALQEEKETHEPGEDYGNVQRLSEEDLIEKMEFADVRKLRTICFSFVI